MEIKKVVGKKIEVQTFCDICKCEAEVYGCLGSPEEQNRHTSGEKCQFCITCYNIFRAELIGRGARFNEVVPELDSCSIGFHSWTHPDDNGNTECLACHIRKVEK